MKNANQVPKKQWNKWSKKAQNVFNEVYGFMMDNQFTMLHPKADPPAPVHYKTMCWNAAWIAADAVDDCIPTDIRTVEAA